MKTLVDKINNGDMDAFAELVERYEDMVYDAAYAVLGCAHNAEEVRQDVFIVAWKKLKSLKNVNRLGGWLYRITRNCSFDMLREVRKHNNSLPADYAECTVTAVAECTPEKHFERSELAASMLAAMDTLSEPNRVATKLFYIDDCSIKEVARRLDIPLGTVRRRLHYSRKRLKEVMTDTETA